MAKMVWRGLANDFSPSTVAGLRRNAVLAASFVFGLAVAISVVAPVSNPSGTMPGFGGSDLGLGQGGAAGDPGSGGAEGGGAPGQAGAIGADGGADGSQGGGSSTTSNHRSGGGGGTTTTTTTGGGGGGTTTDPTAGNLPDPECILNPNCHQDSTGGNPVTDIIGTGTPLDGVSTPPLTVDTTAPPVDALNNTTAPSV